MPDNLTENPSQTRDWYFYMLRCRDNSLYSGMTNNLEERVKKHNAGTGAKYTSSHRPVTLIHSELYNNASDAKKREQEVKRWPKSRKEALILKPSKSEPQESRPVNRATPRQTLF